MAKKESFVSIGDIKNLRKLVDRHYDNMKATIDMACSEGILSKASKDFILDTLTDYYDSISYYIEKLIEYHFKLEKIICID